MTERDHYVAEEERERDAAATNPGVVRQEIYEIMMGYGICHDVVTPLISALELNVEEWVRVCESAHIYIKF